MQSATRRADYRLSLPRFMCGHERTPENMLRDGDCRTCKHAHDRRYRARQRAKRRHRAYDAARYESRTGRVRQRVTVPTLVLTPPVRERKPVVIAPSVLAVIEASRAEYERSIGKASKDSTDRAQLSLSPFTPSQSAQLAAKAS